MSPLGWPLVLILALFATAFLACAFLLWNRLRGPRILQNATRLGLLVLGQLSMVLLVLALANDRAQVYAGWSDIVGHPGSGHTVQAYGQGAVEPSSRAADSHRLRVAPRELTDPPARGGRLGQLQVLGVTEWSSSGQWATRGKVESVAVHGYQSGLSQQGYLYLPPEYFQQKWAHRDFPAVEVLTGYPGSAQAQVTVFNLPGVALRLVRQHRSEPMIYLMMEPTVSPPRDTECTDVPGGPQVQTFLAQEVPSALQGSLRVEPSDWGVMGYSTGGYCATKMLMNHHAVFRAAASLSGYYHTLEDITTGSLWGGSKELQHFNDPEWQLLHTTAPPVSLLVTTSKEETRPDGYPDTMRFLREVKPPMRVTALIEDHGGHNDATWIRELPTVLPWMSRHLATRP